MKSIRDLLGKKIIIGDGAIGTLLQNKISGTFVYEELNLSNPDLIEKILEEYAASGADFLTTNTFGANPLKLKDVSLDGMFKEINTEAVKIARKVADRRNIWVAGDIAACGQLIEPLGILKFDDIVKNFAFQAKVLEEAGADFLIIETITEIQEFRAAVIGALSCVKIPVIASLSFTDDDLSISGTDGSTFAITSDFIGLSAIGSNCGTTLENMRNVIKKIVQYSHLPVLCQANAGIPVIENGKSVFKVNADEYADFMEDIYKMGVSVIGSCCGSTPEFTKKLCERFKNKPVLKRNIEKNLFLSTRTGFKAVSKKKIFLVGERINPTGRKKLRKELEKGKLTSIRIDAKEQEKNGSDALDININLHKLNINIIKNIVLSIQHITNIPLIIDSMDFTVIEEFCKLYAGKGVINSISAEKRSYTKLLPVVKKYNMAFIAALIDDKGIPENSEGRLEVAKKIVKYSLKYNIPKKNIIFDPLVLSAGVEVEKVKVTLKTIELLKREFPENKTIIGLSNVSFGLPNRELVNSSFLAMAVTKGLDMVIANPSHDSIRSQLMALDLLKNGSREHLSTYTKYFSDFKKEVDNTIKMGTENLYDNILSGDIDSARENIKKIIKNGPALNIIDNHIMPAMNEVGRRYQNREYFLPQLIASADVVKAILPFLKENLIRKTDQNEVKILFATVKGDIHDIGKNIVVSILESFNFNIIDLGKDVSPDKVVFVAVENKVDVIGLSTLMTTTMPAMLTTIKLIKKNSHLKGVKIFIGGAVVNKKIADGAGVYFSKDGIEMVNKIKNTI